MNPSTRTMLVLIPAFAVGLMAGHWRGATVRDSPEIASSESATTTLASPSQQDFPVLADPLEPSALGRALIAKAWEHSYKPGPRPEIDGLVGDLDQDALFRLLLERNGMRENKEGRQIEEAIARRLGELPDPERAVAFILSDRKINYERERLLEGLFQSWAGRDSAAALRSLEGITNTILKEHATEGLVAGLAQSDPMSAVKLLASAWGDERVHAHAPAIAAEWALRDPEAALAWIAKIPGASGRAEAELRVVTMLAERDPARALEIISEDIDRFDEHWIDVATTTLTRSDPEAAFRFARALDGDTSASRSRRVLIIWREYDPKAMAEFFTTLGPESREATLWSDLLRTLAEHAPAFLEAFAGKTSEPSLRAEAYSELALQLAPTDLESALAMAERITNSSGVREGAFREETFHRILISHGGSDPIASLATASTLDLSSRLRSLAVSRITTDWAAKDPDAALRGVQALPPEIRATGMTAVLGHLARSEAREAARLFSDYLADPNLTAVEREAMDADPNAIAGIYTGLRLIDPATAANFALTIPPGPARVRTLFEIHQAWAKKDAPAAESARRSWNLTSGELADWEKRQ